MLSDMKSSDVLIIEDDELTRMLIQRILEREFQFEIAAYSNGLEGLKCAQSKQHKLIILDLMLPGMHGYDILKELRSGGLDENTKVIVMSGKSRSEDIERGFELDADEYITKPFQQQEFVVRVRKLLKAG